MDEKTKKDLSKLLENTLDKKFEEKFIPLFNQGFEEVVAPAMEEMEKGLKKEMNQGFDKVNSRLDSLDRRMDVFAIKSADQEKRIKKLETKRAVA